MCQNRHKIWAFFSRNLINCFLGSVLRFQASPINMEEIFYDHSSSISHIYWVNNFFLWMNFFHDRRVKSREHHKHKCATERHVFHTLCNRKRFYFVIFYVHRAAKCISWRKRWRNIVERFINELLVMKYRRLTIANHFAKARSNKLENKKFFMLH